MLLGRRHVGLEPVVVFLRDRLELVVVAAGTADRQTEERRADDVGPLREHLVAAEGDLGIARVSPHRAEPVEDRRGLALGIARLDLVAGDLLGQKPVERLVAVQAVDDVVAEPPRVGHSAVVLVAFGLGVPHDIEPVLGPPLAVPWAGEEPVDQPRIGIDRGVSSRTTRSLRESEAARSGRT